MSWLFSQALVAASSAGTCSDGEPSAQLNVMPTQHKFWRNDKTMDPSDLSRFGLTCAVLTEDRGAALLTWCLEASRARTSASRGRAPASPVSDPACGSTWRELLAKFDPVSCSWRTPQLSLFGGSQSSLQTWPRSGMAVDGLCWGLQTLRRHTSATAYGLWLPTPCTVDAGSYFNKSDSPGAALRPTLGAMAKHRLWPTPTTPAGNCVGRLDEWGGSRSRAAMRELVTPQEIGGQLNPKWVEWLIGWPLGWTDLRPLETAKYHFAPQPHGECSQAAEA